MFKNNFDSLRASLLSREKTLFNSVIKEKYDWAVNDVNKRGVLGSGVGASYIEGELAKTIRERMNNIAIELAEIDLKYKKLGIILSELFGQFSSQAEALLLKPAVWGSPGTEEANRHLKQWNEAGKPALKLYFESEFGVAYSKKRISNKLKFRQTLFWLLAGALLSNTGDLIEYANLLLTSWLCIN